VRLDQLLVDLGLEESRQRARGRILAGDVRIGDRVLDKPGTPVPADAVPVLRERPRFVSRGGEKLAGALDHLEVDPAGLRCLDAGVSTGGFSDCLLERGARAIVAVDVGYGQIAPRLREDPRVQLFERTNMRHFARPADIDPVDLATGDLSFISLCKVLPRLVEWVRPAGRLLLLVKPQFELERGQVGGGVVRDPALRRAAVGRVAEAARALGLRERGGCDSVLPGPKGNVEHFLLLEAPDSCAEGAGPMSP